MAIGMKHWLGIVAVACVLVAFVALPPRTFEGNARPLSPARAHQRDVVREMDRVRRVLLARRWADSLPAHAVTHAQGGLALGLPEESEVTPEGFEEWRADLEGQLDTLSRRHEATVVGFYHVTIAEDSDGRLAAFRLRGTFAGVHEETPYCLRVFPGRDVFDEDLRRSTGPRAGGGLRECRLYAKYGMAGAQLQDWLRSGNAGLATESGEARRERIPYGGYRVAPTEAPLFGMNRYSAFFGGAPSQVLRCVAGRAQACAAAFLGHGDDLGRVVSGLQSQVAMAPEQQLVEQGSLFLSQYLLADLEAQFGEEAFSRFWTSDEPIPEAFETAFAVELGEWMLSWVEAEIGLDEAGPRLRPGTFLPTLLTFMALAAAAGLTQKRRRVG